MDAKTLADRIYEKLCEIPAHNPGVISFSKTTLDDVIDRGLLNKIAVVAAETAISQIHQ